MSESRLEAKAGDSRAIDPARSGVASSKASDESATERSPFQPSGEPLKASRNTGQNTKTGNMRARAGLQFADESHFDGEPESQGWDEDSAEFSELSHEKPSRARAERSSSTQSNGRLEELSDEELVAAFRQGQGTAYRTLIERYKDPLFNYLVRLLGSQSDADDAFQEVFLRVYRALPRFDPERRFKPWLYTIASNLVKNIYRSRAVRKKLSIDREMGDDSGDGGGSLAQMLASADPGPLERASHDERARIVQDLVAKLPNKGRQALVMHYFEGFSYEEIAVISAVPLGTVKSRIHNAIKALVSLIGELSDDLRSA
jgi:RNA polymerase sigma-70 factor (ECF subfamily)